jgi:hypothetical protein
MRPPGKDWVPEPPAIPTGRHVYETTTIKIDRIFVKNRNDRKNFSKWWAVPTMGMISIWWAVPTLRVAGEVKRQALALILVLDNDAPIIAFAHAGQ